MKIRVNKNILWFVLFFFFVSLLSIYCTISFTSNGLGNLFLKQFIWYIVGFITIFIVVKIGNKNIFRYSIFFYLIGNFLLLLLLFFGTSINNSKCWFILPGGISIQPSEFMKIFIMLVLSKIIVNFRKENDYSLRNEFKFIIFSFLVVLIPAILTFLQPDTGSVIIYFVIYFMMLFFSGISLKWFLYLGFMFIFIIGIFVGIYFFNESLLISIFGTSFYYRIERFFMWKNGIGMQLENSLSAIGSSGLFGHGFNKTPIYFPESSTDFIFAVYASNFGFVAVCIFLLVLVGFDFYILKLMKEISIVENKMILSGILGMLLFQQIQNIGMTIGLLPITGITLPFISYGGSSLISYMFIIGMVINIASFRRI